MKNKVLCKNEKRGFRNSFVVHVFFSFMFAEHLTVKNEADCKQNFSYEIVQYVFLFDEIIANKKPNGPSNICLNFLLIAKQTKVSQIFFEIFTHQSQNEFDLKTHAISSTRSVSDEYC